MNYKIKTTLVVQLMTIMFLFQGCENILEEENISQLQADNLLTTQLGLESVIADAYSQIAGANNIRDIVKREEMTSDEMWQTGGGENGTASSLIAFFWDSNNSLEAFDWGKYWNAIRDANTVLDNIDNVTEISGDLRAQLIAEVRFLRIWAYYSLWNQFGSMPIRTSLSDSRELARASEEEFSAFMESEMLAAIPDLPEPGDEPNYGRVHSGGARALLTKWYLNTKQWQKCADMAKQIIDRGNFDLFPSAFDLFALDNERNSEFILVKALAPNTNNGNNLVPTMFPPDFYEGIDGGLAGVVNTTWSNFASQYRLYDEFYNSFEEGDTRRQRIITKYNNSKGEEVNLLATADNTRAMKFPPDPATQGVFHGNDFPAVRYADILLARAEALNELNGPNQGSIDLINQIRNRAELDDITAADYPTKESLRDHILDERRWEFWSEGKRRRDMLRMGKYISNAQARGKNAQEKHKLFPIPQSEIDANKLIEQNPGY